MDPSCLLSDEAFARRIAIGLLRDRDAAEDLVQEAWLEVLEKRPRDVGSPRGFVAALLRRLWSRKQRAEGRRRTRERASARPEALADDAALVARAEIHGRTVIAVLALEEPYRSTVLRRFFEDRTPADIAALEGIPEETVRTRLKRALAMLRARLETEGRDWREEWVVALTGSRAWPEPEPVRGSPWKASLRAWGSGVGVAVVLTVVWLARSESTRDGAPRARLEGERVADADEAVRGNALALSGSEVREPLVPEAAPPSAPTAPFLSGRARDERGRPLAGVRVELAISRYGRGSDLSVATSDESGVFACSLAGWDELSAPARALLGLDLHAWANGHAPLAQQVEFTPDGRPREPELVLAAGRVLSGRVLDPTGAPADAFVTARTYGGQASTNEHRGMGLTDREGWFAIGLDEGESVSELQVEGPAGFAYLGAGSLPARTSGDVTLAPIAMQTGHTLVGRCVYPDGTPVRGLNLQTRQVETGPDGALRPVQRTGAELVGGLSQRAALTDETGSFVLAGLGAGTFQVLDSTGPLEQGRAWNSDASGLELVLARRRLRVEVVDLSGRSIEEARIAVTRLASNGEPVALPMRTMTTGAPPFAPVTVAPGESLAVLAVVPGCALVEQQLAVPDGTYEPALRLELVPEERDAALVLSPSSGPRTGWRVGLCAPLSLVRVPGYQDLACDAEGRVAGLPRGRYRVRIEARAIDGSRAWCARAATVPVVLGEGDNVLAFEVQSAAHLRIVFTDANAQGSDLQPVSDLESSAASTERYGWMSLAMLRSRGSLELRSAADGSAALLRRVTELRPKAGQFLDLVVPATPAHLKIELPDHEPFEHELFPSAGEVLEIPVPLSTAPAPR